MIEKGDTPIWGKQGEWTLYRQFKYEEPKMKDLLQYMAVDVDELTRKTALSSDNVCCGSDELTYLRETTNFVNYTGKPREPRLQVDHEAQKTN